MASFHALNIESDEESDDEIDNTKEIQIEEALKVYQNALKLHSQKETLNDAGKEYETLFESEVFRLPEAQSEYNRVEALEGQIEDEGISYQEIGEVQEVNQTTADNAPNTLPQLLHLSYKNRGEYHLDILKNILNKREIRPGDHLNYDDREDVQSHASKALQDFAEALDKDEDDLDLWRRAAKIAEILGHDRISRFCLEAALEGDLDTTDDVLGRPGFDAEFSGHELYKLQGRLEDKLSRNQPPLSNIHLRDLPPVLKKNLSLYPSLPIVPAAQDYSGEGTRRYVLDLKEKSWESTGREILSLIKGNHSVQKDNLDSFLSITFKAPTDPEDHLSSLTLDESSSNKNPIASPVDDLLKSPISKQDTNDKIKTADDSKTKGPTTSGENGTTTTLPSRKRTNEVAELPETADGERGRSKRIRARESTINKRLPGEPDKTDVVSRDELKFQSILEADQWLFEVTDSISQVLNLGPVEHPKALRELIHPTPDTPHPDQEHALPLARAIKDFHAAFKTWKQAKTHVLNKKVSKDATSEEAGNPGLTDFLGHSKSNTEPRPKCTKTQGIDKFIKEVNSSCVSIPDIALSWLQYLFTPDDLASINYRDFAWSEELKQTVEEIVLEIEDNLYGYMNEMTAYWLAKITNPNSSANIKVLSEIFDYAQSLFELHLDIVSQLVHNTSKTNLDELKDRNIWLERWCGLSRDLMNIYATFADPKAVEKNANVTRHFWCTVFRLQLLDGVPREHLISCIEDLIAHLSTKDDQCEILLPNSTIMPRLSIEAAEKEKSKLETMDFFISIFRPDQHPVDLIEKLEPMLEPINSSLEFSNNENGQEGKDKGKENAAPTNSTIQALSDFLRNANSSLRLTLWRRLRNAYQEIDYPPKIFSINYKIIQIIISDLKTDTYATLKSEEREPVLLKAIAELGDLIVVNFDLMENSTSIFECIDQDEIQNISKILTEISSMLYMVSVYDDHCQISQKGAPLMNPFRTYPSESFHPASIRLHDMQVKIGLLRYKVFEEATKQAGEVKFAQDADLLNYLRNMHHALGVRRLCKASDSLFLHFMRREISKLNSEGEESSDDLAQILYDLYDLQCFSSPTKRQDHGCDADYLERTESYELAELVLGKAQNVILKDLMKSELGKTVEKLHQATGKPQNPHTMQRNRKVITTRLNEPINPLDLYQSLNGIGSIPHCLVATNEAVLAAKGWYFLMGQISLAKYKAARSKGTAVPTDDLENAINYFSQDLGFSTDNWESWFRFAQAHDALIEEQVLWSAEKINGGVQDLAQTQRAAIHAYTIACATALRSVEPTEENKVVMSDLYTDFGMRIYSSSCPPFSMEAFSMADFPDKICSGVNAAGNGLYHRRPFRGLQNYQAWKFASVLFRRAITLKPERWLNHYMLGKCLWKLHQAAEAQQNSTGPSSEDVVTTFMGAVEATPRKDSNRQEPTLEPTYKLVSVVHKLVNRGQIEENEGEETILKLLDTQNQFDPPKVTMKLSDFDSWTDFILDIFKILRQADKARWHHRIVAQIAQVKYRTAGRTPEAAKIAKDYLIDQHFYSAKTMALTVWKPDNERPGRHWVYMSRYARFVTRLLEQCDDLEGMQALARRVRKKSNEFYSHADLWSSVCKFHLRLHRRHGEIPDRLEDEVLKNLTLEEIGPKLDQIDEWIMSESSQHTLLDILREVTELKKLNANLIRAFLIDDLINDTYAAIYERIGPTLGDPAPPKPTEPPAAATPPERKNIMALNHLMNTDGAAETKKPSPEIQAQLYGEALARRARAKPVTRREVLKRATDAGTMSAARAKATAPTSKTPVRQQHDSGCDDKKVPNMADQDQEAAQGASIEETKDKPQVDDDDSELSELASDEDLDPEDIMASSRRLFPNLQTEDQSALNSEGDMDGARENEADDEEEEDDGSGSGLENNAELDEDDQAAQEEDNNNGEDVAMETN